MNCGPSSNNGKRGQGNPSVIVFYSFTGAIVRPGIVRRFRRGYAFTYRGKAFFSRRSFNILALRRSRDHYRKNVTAVERIKINNSRALRGCNIFPMPICFRENSAYGNCTWKYKKKTSPTHRPVTGFATGNYPEVSSALAAESKLLRTFSKPVGFAFFDMPGRDEER